MADHTADGSAGYVEEHAPEERTAWAVRRPTPHPVYWVIAASLITLVAMEAVRTFGPPNQPAMAQPVLSGGARGVFAFSGQLAKSTYGMYVVDVDAMTVWVYEYLPAKGCLRLAAARTWRYDRYLEDFNICGPSPAEIEQLIENQRAYRIQSSESQMP